MKNNITNLAGLFIAGCLAMGVATATPGHAGAPESDDPIKIVLNDWTGQLVSSHIAAGILEDMGYNTEFVQADYYAMFPGLESGDLTVAMEVWYTTAADVVAASVATGNTTNLGSLGLEGEDFWWYPAYMEEKCPGLPDWTALQDPACAEAFANEETYPKGRFVSAPITWGEDDDARVVALGLPIEVIHAGSDAAMFAELQAAYERREPILIWLWTPHWATARFEGSRVEFPPHEPECYTDPSWGLNPDMLYDCGKASGPIWKIAWADGEAKWPAAYATMRDIKIDKDTMNDLIGRIELDGEELESVVREWLEANESVWRGWVH